MNKDNPITSIILVIVVIVVLLVAWAIGKFSSDALQKEDQKSDTKNKIASIGKNVFYLIIGSVLILVFAKLWFALVGEPD